MYFLLLEESFHRNPKRKIAAGIMIMFAASLIFSLLTVAIDIGDKMSGELRSYGANITMLPQSNNVILDLGDLRYNPLAEQAFLNEPDVTKIKEIFWHNNIIAFAPFLTITGELNGRQKLTVIGTYFDKTMPVIDEDNYHTGVKELNPSWRVDGDWPKDDAPDGEPAGILVGADLAREMNLKPNDKVTLKTAAGAGEEYMVTGIVATGGMEDNCILAPLAMVQRLAGLEDKISSVSIRALTVPENSLARKHRANPDALNAKEADVWYCTPYVSSIAYQIEEAVPGAQVKPVWQIAESEGLIIGKIQVLMLMVTAVSSIVAAIGISSLKNITVRERAKEIGLMKSVGAADRDIYLLFTGEAVIEGIIGGLLGCFTGYGLAQLVSTSIFNASCALAPVVIPVIIVLSVIISLVSALIPCRLISRLRPAEVLHGME